MSVASWTQADIDALRTAIASGVKTVKYGGPPAREKTYQDIREMRDLLASMERSVAKPTRFRRVAFNKGFGR